MLEMDRKSQHKLLDLYDYIIEINSELLGLLLVANDRTISFSFVTRTMRNLEVIELKKDISDLISEGAETLSAYNRNNNTAIPLSQFLGTFTFSQVSDKPNTTLILDIKVDSQMFRYVQGYREVLANMLFKLAMVYHRNRNLLESLVVVHHDGNKRAEMFITEKFKHISKRVIRDIPVLEDVKISDIVALGRLLTLEHEITSPVGDEVKELSIIQKLTAFVKQVFIDKLIDLNNGCCEFVYIGRNVLEDSVICQDMTYQELVEILRNKFIISALYEADDSDCAETTEASREGIEVILKNLPDMDKFIAELTAEHEAARLDNETVQLDKIKDVKKDTKVESDRPVSELSEEELNQFIAQYFMQNVTLKQQRLFENLSQITGLSLTDLRKTISELVDRGLIPNMVPENPKSSDVVLDYQDWTYLMMLAFESTETNGAICQEITARWGNQLVGKDYSGNFNAIIKKNWYQLTIDGFNTNFAELLNWSKQPDPNNGDGTQFKSVLSLVYRLMHVFPNTRYIGIILAFLNDPDAKISILGYCNAYPVLSSQVLEVTEAFHQLSKLGIIREIDHKKDKLNREHVWCFPYNLNEPGFLTIPQFSLEKIFVFIEKIFFGLQTTPWQKAVKVDFWALIDLLLVQDGPTNTHRVCTTLGVSSGSQSVYYIGRMMNWLAVCGVLENASSLENDHRSARYALTKIYKEQYANRVITTDPNN